MERIPAFAPDVIVLDIAMPRLNGYETARRIRAQPGTHIILVALTAWAMDDHKQRALDAGFDFHFEKPLSPEDLQHMLDACA